jgi:NTE family protein
MDWIDEADGVFRGGGVKGLGLAGALLGFAEHPTKPIHRWVNVAGASAGAIIACYLACGHGPEDMAKLMKETKFGDFQDFPHGGEFLGGIPNLLFKHGLAHGNAFRDWFSDKLDHTTFAEMKGADDDWSHSRLKLIACDVTNRRLLVLPEDLPNYREPGATEPIDPAKFEIAHAARWSMSIPYFFEPIEVDLVRDEHGAEIEPRRSVIVDGGTLSNFPVWLFDVSDSAPCRPTFGFTLTGGHGVGAGFSEAEGHLPWLARLGFDIFHTAQEAWDTRFVSHSTRVRSLAVDATVTGPDGKPYAVNTTDFNLSPARQDALIENGRTAAQAFLEKFDLSQYMNTFHRTIEAPQPAAVGG